MGLLKDSPFFPVKADQVILESRNCLAFFDRYPVSVGHALVVPRIPVSSLFALDDQMQADIWDTVRRVRGILETRFHPAGFNIGVNDGQAAGQTVPHAHVHVIPRYVGDVADPRGGIRWVLPEKARYWGTKTAPHHGEVIGIDVGVTKGLHVVALSLAEPMSAGTFTVLGNGVPVAAALRLCLTRKPACVAIDSPPNWARTGNARGGEQELRKLEIALYSTPSDPRKQRSNFYGWMKVGFRVFEGLRPQYPLYRKGKLGRHALEVFPHATAIVLAGWHRPTNIRKAAWRKQILAEQGFNVDGLRNADSIDAALAAVTAAYALRGTFSAFGNPAEGVIVTPREDAAERLRAAMQR